MRWTNVVPLLIFIAMIAAAFLVIRPRARRARHRQWEQAGLMPDQLDPHRPVPAEDPQDPEDDGRR